MGLFSFIFGKNSGETKVEPDRFVIIFLSGAVMSLKSSGNNDIHYTFPVSTGSGDIVSVEVPVDLNGLFYKMHEEEINELLGD